MRVIGGEFRSRRLIAVPGDSVRPTPDRLRETLFNILAPELDDDVTFVDAYAGTGAVGIEALSRGARDAVFIEKHKAAVEILEKNLENLKVRGKARVIRGSAQLMLPRHPGEIVFLDPPYPLTDEYDLALNLLGASDSRIVVMQHAIRQPLAETYGKLRRYRVVKQGDNCLSFFSPV